MTALQPLVTAVVATLNEEKHIARCLRQLLDQRPFGGELEIFVIDGGSVDRTVEIVRSSPEFAARVRVLKNPHRFQVYAYNQGLREARGTYVMFVVAHAEYAENYVAEAIALSERMNAANVAGVPKAVGEGAIGKTIAWAMSSPFGVGDATFRYFDAERYADSVFVGFLRRDTLLRIGGFNEQIHFDEDTDLNLRLRRAGYRLATSPRLQCRYYVRASLTGLATQMFRYGFWRRKTQLVHGANVPLRVLAPPALVFGLILSLVLPWPLRWVVPGAYVAFLTLAALKAAPRIGMLAILVPIVVPTMHVAYGLGWMKGLFVHRKTKEPLTPAEAPNS